MFLNQEHHPKPVPPSAAPPLPAPPLPRGAHLFIPPRQPSASPLFPGLIYGRRLSAPGRRSLNLAIVRGSSPGPSICGASVRPGGLPAAPSISSLRTRGSCTCAAGGLPAAPRVPGGLGEAPQGARWVCREPKNVTCSRALALLLPPPFFLHLEKKSRRWRPIWRSPLGKGRP